MIRLLIRIGLALLGDAIGLWIASLVLDGMTIDGLGFVLAVVIFTVLTFVFEPLIDRVASNRAPALSGGSALISTFLSLLITDLVSDGLNIEGVGTWVAATVIVWICTMIAGWLLPLLFLRNVRENRR